VIPDEAVQAFVDAWNEEGWSWPYVAADYYSAADLAAGRVRETTEKAARDNRAFARALLTAAAPAIIAANQHRRTPPPCGLGGAHLLDVGHAISQALGGKPWSWTWRPDPSRDLIRIEDSRLPAIDGVAVLQRVTEDVANTHPGAVPGWSWAGHTEPLRDRTGQPLGCDATPEQVADAVLAETEPRW
jgi:hypothetical protein